jgi:release factor glutamine methyltransferase
MWLTRLPGVYPPQDDTWLLGDALATASIPPGGDVLDVGCGTGALSVLTARTRPRSITAADLSRRAVLSTRLNTFCHGVRARVTRGDALELVHGRTFDLVVANPPYVPGVAGVPCGRDRAWDAGVDGRAMLDRLCAAAPRLLAPGGVLLLVHSGLCDEDTTLQQLHDGGLKAAVVARAEVPFGPVMRARARRLCELGLVTDDQRTEELVVVRGDRPQSP